MTGSAAACSRSGPGWAATSSAGFFPVNLESPGQLAQIVAGLGELRRAANVAAQPYDVIAALPPGTDPAPYAAAGATWWRVEFPSHGPTADLVRSVIRDGPATPP